MVLQTRKAYSQGQRHMPGGSISIGRQAGSKQWQSDSDSEEDVDACGSDMEGKNGDRAAFSCRSISSQISTAP